MLINSESDFNAVFIVSVVFVSIMINIIFFIIKGIMTERKMLEFFELAPGEDLKTDNKRFLPGTSGVFNAEPSNQEVKKLVDVEEVIKIICESADAKKDTIWYNETTTLAEEIYHLETVEVHVYVGIGDKP